MLLKAAGTQLYGPNVTENCSATGQKILRAIYQQAVEFQLVETPLPWMLNQAQSNNANKSAASSALVRSVCGRGVPLSCRHSRIQSCTA